MIYALLLFLFGIINLTYYIVHANGKKNVRLFSAIVLFVLSFTSLGWSEHHPWLIVTSLLSVMDTITDWNIKNKNRAGG